MHHRTMLKSKSFPFYFNSQGFIGGYNEKSTLRETLAPPLVRIEGETITIRYIRILVLLLFSIYVFCGDQDLIFES